MDVATIVATPGMKEHYMSLNRGLLEARRILISELTNNLEQKEGFRYMETNAYNGIIATCNMINDKLHELKNIFQDVESYRNVQDTVLSLTTNEKDHIKYLLKEKRIIGAIKYVRNGTTLGLKEGKDVVECIRAEMAMEDDRDPV